MKILTKAELAEKRMAALETLFDPQAPVGKNKLEKQLDRVQAWMLLSEMIEEAE